MALEYLPVGNCDRFPGSHGPLVKETTFHSSGPSASIIVRAWVAIHGAIWLVTTAPIELKLDSVNSFCSALASKLSGAADAHPGANGASTTVAAASAMRITGIIDGLRSTRLKRAIRELSFLYERSVW